LLEHDKHGDTDDYPVHSIYLDDIVNTGATDKAFGNEIHQKYRIRFYDKVDEKKLELKHKIGNESTKRSTQINDELYNGIITQDLDIIEKYISDELISRFMLDMLRFNLEPKVQIRYQREAYKDSTDNLRVTFDHSLMGDWFKDEDFSVDNRLLLSDKLILEVKYEHYLPKNIKVIINKTNPDLVAYSKYFLGYSSLGI
jgi:hypothetical protein